MRWHFSFLCCLALIPFQAFGQDSTAEVESEEEPVPAKPIAVLDIKNSKEGSIPGGSSMVEGKWRVAKESEELRVLTEPLVVSRLEFGPEVREKGSTVLATGSAPGEGRLQSRFGAGLYGKNGFHLRLVPLQDEIELVRRGEVLRSAKMALEPGRRYTIELSVLAEEDQWLIRGSSWDAESGAEDAVTIEYRIFADELLFPLAGRAVLTGTPFSGQPVAFTAAEFYPEGYIREEAEAAPEDQPGEEE